ncbi:MAG: 3-hydroxybutyrate dehydrogenase [Candidatus Pelagadaptatus aseana]|uniref:3-hydroxybutyrate dehydrogenase n=1 Tax=Candidatus Pelagadaptatus aseana TaxID=3120508 RepID=UPI0039B17553
MLDSKVAIVTGSTSGIGLAIAKQLASSGCHIVLNGLAESEKIDTLLREISDMGVNAQYISADMSKPDEIEAMIADVYQKHGRIDVLVNNAGVQHVAAVEEFSREAWDKVIAINLSSVFHAIKAVTPIMKQQGWGRIINVASIHGKVASPYKSAYVAAKHGVLGLTKTVALELATTGVTCNAICPGYVLTPLVENQISDTAKARGISEQQVMDDVLLGTQPTGRFTSADDVGAMVVFLCGAAANNITGSEQVMDGGYISG